MKKILFYVLVLISYTIHSQTILIPETDSLLIITTDTNDVFDYNNTIKIYATSITLKICETNLRITYKSDKKSEKINSYSYTFENKINPNKSFYVKSYDSCKEICFINYEKNKQISIKYNKLLLVILNLNQ